jgi:hypothetical protein
VSQGRPESKKMSKRSMLGPPQGPIWEVKFELVVNFPLFWKCRSVRLPGQILSAFGKVLNVLNMFL